MIRGTRLFSILIRLYPRAFRERYHTELLAFFEAERQHPRYGAGALRPARFWFATIRDLVRAAASERFPARRRAVPNGGSPMRWLSALAFDVRNAIRSLVGTPAVTTTALLVIALGIGVSASIFSVVDGVVLRGLPYGDADELVAVHETDIGTGVAAAQRALLGMAGRPVPAAHQNYEEWVARQDVFESMAASATAAFMTTADAERPERLRPHRITANLLGVLRVRPAMGSGITPEHEQTDARVAVISDGLWRRRFNAAPDVLGQTIAFDTGTYTIVGVMGPEFMYPVGPAVVSNVDFWIPYVPTPRDRVRGEGRSYFTRVVARLAPGVSLEQASARMTQIRDALAQEYPRWFEDHGILVRRLKDSIVPDAARSWMLMLLAAVGAVFLVACANIANLLLVRASGRTREIGVRAAMGASRGQIVRGLMVESTVLALCGAAGGIVLAYWGVDVLRASLPSNLPRLWTIAVDLRVIAATTALALATGALCGLLPALQMSRADVSAALRTGGRSATTGGRNGRIRTAFLITEIALAATLLVGAGIFASSFVRLVRTDMGFDPENVLSVQATPRPPSLQGSLNRDLAQEYAPMVDVLERVRALPGVRAAALVAGGAPLTGSWQSVPVQIGDRTWNGEDEAVMKVVTSDYLETIGATLVGGRWLSASDTRGAPAVVVLNDEAVRRYVGQGDPIGVRIAIDTDPPRTVVGVVRGMRLLGPETEIRPEVYLPYDQTPRHSVSASLLLRTAGPPAALIPAVKTAVWEVMPSAVIPEPMTFDAIFAQLVAQRKLNMILLSLFGMLALLIALIGVYGMLAYAVEQRTKEIGVRMALGALPHRILSMVLTRAAATILGGMAIGFIVAAWLERVVMAFVYRGIPRDPLVYGGAALVLALLGLLAAYVPARRASRVDPLIALRAE